MIESTTEDRLHTDLTRNMIRNTNLFGNNKDSYIIQIDYMNYKLIKPTRVYILELYHETGKEEQDGWYY